jgi:hypothetical protein
VNASEAERAHHRNFGDAIAHHHRHRVGGDPQHRDRDDETQALHDGFDIADTGHNACKRGGLLGGLSLRWTS